MPRSSFAAALAFGRSIEIAAAAWLKKRGALILPVYDYCGLANDKAPRLEAFSSSDSLVTPDLLVARKGLLSWVEVKHKSESTWFRNKGREETGIETRLWRSYQNVAKCTGAHVWLMFLHSRGFVGDGVVKPGEVLVQDAFILASDQRDGSMFQGGRKVPMTYFPTGLMMRIADYSDVVGARAA